MGADLTISSSMRFECLNFIVTNLQAHQLTTLRILLEPWGLEIPSKHKTGFKKFLRTSITKPYWACTWKLARTHPPMVDNLTACQWPGPPQTWATARIHQPEPRPPSSASVQLHHPTTRPLPPTSRNALLHTDPESPVRLISKGHRTHTPEASHPPQSLPACATSCPDR